MMRGGANVRTIIILVILVLVGILGVLGMNTIKTYMSGAAGGEEPVGVLVKRSEDGSSATITWSTEKDTQGVVEYGTTPASLLLRKSEAEMSTSHWVLIDSLVAEKPYYFRIRIGEEVYDNNGIPYSIKQAVASEEEMEEVGPGPTIMAQDPTPPQEMAPCAQKVDRNNDGVINGLDVAICLRQQAGSSQPSGVTGTPTDACRRLEADTNKDGRVSGAEYIQCRQSSQ